jgi:hypothetical protein
VSEYGPGAFVIGAVEGRVGYRLPSTTFGNHGFKVTRQHLFIAQPGHPAGQGGPFGVTEPPGGFRLKGGVVGCLGELHDVASAGYHCRQRVIGGDAGRFHDD